LFFDYQKPSDKSTWTKALEFAPIFSSYISGRDAYLSFRDGNYMAGSGYAMLSIGTLALDIATLNPGGLGAKAAFKPVRETLKKEITAWLARAGEGFGSTAKAAVGVGNKKIALVALDAAKKEVKNITSSVVRDAVKEVKSEFGIKAVNAAKTRALEQTKEEIYQSVKQTLVQAATKAISDAQLKSTARGAAQSVSPKIFGAAFISHLEPHLSTLETKGKFEKCEAAKAALEDLAKLFKNKYRAPAGTTSAKGIRAKVSSFLAIPYRDPLHWIKKTHKMGQEGISAPKWFAYPASASADLLHTAAGAFIGAPWHLTKKSLKSISFTSKPKKLLAIAPNILRSGKAIYDPFAPPSREQVQADEQEAARRVVEENRKKAGQQLQEQQLREQKLNQQGQDSGQKTENQQDRPVQVEQNQQSKQQYPGVVLPKIKKDKLINKF